MAIKGPWVGSSAKAETGQSWMTAAGRSVRVGAPFWMSSLIGKSKSIQVYINSSDHYYDLNKLLNAVRAVMPQNQWNGVELQLYVGNGVQLVSSVTTAPCLDFGYLSVFSKITLENKGIILGRGGNGGDTWSPPGNPGGTAIVRNATLYINNLGVIGGGGGGGGGRKLNGGGGGGAPLGMGGRTGGGKWDGPAGVNASFSGPGANGGYYGAPGTSIPGVPNSGAGGAAGAAITGSGTFGWINRGTVYGSAP